MKFVQLENSLRQGLAPVYLIAGEETYFRDHAVAKIRAACGIANPALNDVRVEGETLKGDRLLSFRDELRFLPFLDGKRLVRVYEFYPTEREWEKILRPYAEHPCDSTVLLIVNSGKRGNACDLTRKKEIVYVDCGREDEETLTRWLYALMKREGLQPDADAAGLMVRYCASDAARMKKETEKLGLLLGEGGRVTRTVVEEHIAEDAEYRIYELTQAASRGNTTAFWEILSDLLRKGYDETAALSALTSHFKTLSEIAGMRGSDEEIGNILGMKPYPVKKNRELAARIGRARAEELYRALYALGSDMRSGLVLKSGALSCAIAEIFFG